jgi:hypothetical protein
MKKHATFLIIALLIISNVIFISTTLSYKSKLNTAEAKLAPENYKLYFFEGEDNNIKLTNGVVIISPNKELVNGGKIEYVGKGNEKIIAYTTTLYLDKEGKKDVIFSNSASLGAPNGITFSDEFSLNKTIGGISSKKLFSADSLEKLKDNLYLSIDYVKDNFEKGNFTVKLKVTEYNR